MKTVKFILGIVTFILSCFGAYMCYSVSGNILSAKGWELFGWIFSIPILIMIYIIEFGLLVSTLFRFINTIGSESKAIRIISIIMLILTIALALFMGYNVFKLFY